MSSDTVVETINLEKTYMQGNILVPAIRGINLRIEAGELVSILGPSGSGKSTLMNLIGALDYPSVGKILINGSDTSKMRNTKLAELRQRVGFVFQYFNLIPRLTAYQNVLLAAQVQARLTRKERDQKVREILKIVGLEERMHHKPAELSGGQQQRVAIARALVQNPAFLLMDEPTGNVDTKTRNMIIDLIKKLNEEQKITTIIITHDIEIAKHTKRTVYLVDGMIEKDVPVSELSQITHQIMEGA